MARQASDWLDSGRLGHELRVAESHPSYSELPTLIAGAVQWVSAFTGLPLLDKFLTVSRPARGTDSSINLGRVVAPVAVTRVRWWSTAETDGADGTLLERLDGADVVPDVGRLVLAPPHALSPTLIQWPRASGWPDGMRRIEFTIQAGLSPVDYPAISDACVLHCRSQFEGHVLADKRGAIDRLLEPLMQMDLDGHRGC